MSDTLKHYAGKRPLGLTGRLRFCPCRRNIGWFSCAARGKLNSTIGIVRYETSILQSRYNIGAFEGERKSDFFVAKRHHIKHLDLDFIWFGTRGSEVQILSSDRTPSTFEETVATLIKSQAFLLSWYVRYN